MSHTSSRCSRLSPLMIVLGLAWVHASLVAQPSFQLDSTVRYDYLSGDTVRTERVIFKYNQDGRTAEEQRQVWSQNNWQDDSRITYDYRGNLLVRTTNWIHMEGDWVPEDRIVNIYNSLDILSEVLTQEWEVSTSSWINQTNNVLATKEGDRRTRIRFVWNTNQQQWLKVDSTITLSNENGQVESDTVYLWIALAQSYIYQSHRSNQYDSLHNLTETVRYHFSTETLDFVPRSRDRFGYDSIGFQWLSQFDIWNGQQQAWEPSLRIERTSNADGYLASSKIFFADFLSGDLLPTSRLEYVYTDGKERGEADSLILSVKNIIYQGNIEVPDWKTHYYYSGGPATSLSQNQIEVEISIYPNPAVHSVTLQTRYEGPLHWTWIGNDGRSWSSGTWNGQLIAVPSKNKEGVFYLVLTTPDLRWSRAFPVWIQ